MDKREHEKRNLRHPDCLFLANLLRAITNMSRTSRTVRYVLAVPSITRPVGPLSSHPIPQPAHLPARADHPQHTAHPSAPYKGRHQTLLPAQSQLVKWPSGSVYENIAGCAGARGTVFVRSQLERGGSVPQVSLGDLAFCVFFCPFLEPQMNGRIRCIFVFHFVWFILPEAL